MYGKLIYPKDPDEGAYKAVCTKYLTDKSAIAMHCQTLMDERPPDEPGRNGDFSAS